MTIPRVRRLLVQDVDAVMAIQGNCYSTDFIEPVAAMHAHIESGHPCWFVELNGHPVGYLLCAQMDTVDLPSPIELGTANRLPPHGDPTWLYVHDLAVHPDFHGYGISRLLLDQAWTHCAASPSIGGLALVAVQSSTPFWARQGFQVCLALPPSIASKLSTYGPDARYMYRTLAR